MLVFQTPPAAESHARRYLVLVSALLLAGIVVLSPSALVMHNVGEALSLQELAHKQIGAGTLYSPYFEVDEYTYKLALYRERKPEVVVVGSSLPLPLMRDHVGASFVNLGRTMPALVDGLPLLHDLFSVHKPKLVVIVLDFWWFNAAFPDEPRASPAPDRLPHWSFRRATAPFSWLSAGTVGAGEFSALLRLDPRQVGLQGFGLTAIRTKTGYDSHGSRWAPRPNRPISYAFDNTFARIRRGDQRFEYGAKVDQGRWDELLAMRKLADGAGVRTIVILPPLAARVQDKMRDTGRYGYVTDLRDRLASQLLAFDFFDAESVGSSDCEFHSDGFHLAVAGWARISQTLGAELPPDLGRLFGAVGASRTIDEFEAAGAKTGPRRDDCRTAREPEQNKEEGVR